MKLVTQKSKRISITTKNLKITPMCTASTFAAKSVNMTKLYLSNVLTSVTGFLTALVRPMWLFFLSAPFISSTSNTEKASPLMPKTTRNSDSTPSVRGASSKKSTQTSKRSSTQSTNPVSTISAVTKPQSKSSSIGVITSSNKKPKGRGRVRATSSPASTASSAVPKRNVKQGRNSTTK